MTVGNFAVVLVIVAIVAWLGLAVRRRHWETWRTSLPLEDDDARRLVDAYTRRSIWFRFTPVALIFLAPIVWALWVQRSMHIDQVLHWGAMVSGYVLGVMLSGLALPTPQETEERSARLAPRRIRDVVDHRLLWALAWLPALAVALSPLYVALPTREEKYISDAGVVAIAMAAVGAALLGLAVLRGVLTRRLPATSEQVLVAWEAIRFSSVRAIAAATVSLLMVHVATILYQFALPSDVGPVGTVAGFASLGLMIGAIGVWASFGRPIPVADPAPSRQ